MVLNRLVLRDLEAGIFEDTSDASSDFDTDDEREQRVRRAGYVRDVANAIRTILHAVKKSLLNPILEKAVTPIFESAMDKIAALPRDIAKDITNAFLRCINLTAIFLLVLLLVVVVLVLTLWFYGLREVLVPRLQTATPASHA